jgi:hypothetical protein
MIRSRLGFKALGMCALIVGLMGIWTGVAQAEEPGGKWTYINPTTKELKTFEGVLHEPSISGELEKDEKGVFIPAVLHAKVLGGTSLLYECKEVLVVEGKLKLEGIVLGKLVFHECETFLNGVLSKNCNPNAGGIHPGLIETNLIKAQMLLHKLIEGGVKDEILVAEPEDKEGKLLTTFAIVESTEACSIGQKVPIGGRFAFWDPVDPLTHLVRHLIKEFLPLTHLYAISDTAEHAAEILGGAWAFLSGEHKNYEWAGLWN